MVKVLRRADIEVVVPPGQLCCGAPALALGDAKLARRLADVNLRALEETGADYYVTPCALGASTIRIDYRDMVGEEAARVSARLHEFSGFAWKFIDLAGLEPVGEKVTYHDPCHLRWVQEVEDAPRELLRRSSSYVEMEGSDDCCGAGNLFALFRRDLAEKIGQEKVSAIRSTDADMVATACPICMLQLETLVAKAGAPVKVCHLAQVLARALPTENLETGER